MTKSLRQAQLQRMQLDLKWLQLLRASYNEAASEVREKYDMGEDGNNDDVIAELNIRTGRLTNDFDTKL
jgi:hypothetical protein